MSTAYAGETNQTPTQTNKFKLPKKSYKLRIIDCEFGRSKEKVDPNTGAVTGNNPMFTRTWEIVEPSSVTIKVNGESVVVPTSGIKLKDWLTLTSKTANVVRADSERLGVDLPDDETPNIAGYIGKEACAILRTDVTDHKDEETGEPILDSKGEPVKAYQHQIGEWLN